MIDYYEKWKKFIEKNDTEARNWLIAKYLHLAKYVASKIPRYSYLYTYQDIAQWACIGLIKAIESFDPEKGIKFETFAISRIKGEIYDNLRKLSPKYSKIKKRIEKAYEKLYQIYNRPPTYKELAKEINISEAKLKKLLKDYSFVFIISLQDIIKEKILKNNTIDRESFFELKDIISKSIEKLREKEKVVIHLYYYEGLTFKEISEIMNISESRVSQIHSMAIFHLKQFLKNYGPFKKNENNKRRI